MYRPGNWNRVHGRGGAGGRRKAVKTEELESWVGAGQAEEERKGGEAPV